MRLSTNELRNRAAAFAQKHASATYEKGETQTFYNEFFNIFGVECRQVARYEEHVKKLNNKSGFIDETEHMVVVSNLSVEEQLCPNL